MCAQACVRIEDAAKCWAISRTSEDAARSCQRGFSLKGQEPPLEVVFQHTLSQVQIPQGHGKGGWQRRPHLGQLYDPPANLDLLLGPPGLFSVALLEAKLLPSV